MEAHLYVLYNLYIEEVLIIFAGRAYFFSPLNFFLWLNNKDYEF